MTDGETAGFSSRGAALGTHDLKPDIAAPGVAIVGAQADSPGGIHYIAMSGTSMATPHVAAPPRWCGRPTPTGRRSRSRRR